jgi:hypothetical protein
MLRPANVAFGEKFKSRRAALGKSQDEAPALPIPKILRIEIRRIGRNCI